MNCPCNEPGWCNELQREMTTRDMQICQGVNPAGLPVVSPERRAKYLAYWYGQAGKPAAITSAQRQLTKYKPCNCGKRNVKKLF